MKNNNLHNHDGELSNGAAEKLIECLPAEASAQAGAKGEKLSFWK